MPSKHYRIGTRGSLLALTQCNQVKDQLEKLTGDTFELIEIKTEGDLITNAPLWQLDGKDFFSKELDEALLSGRVDLVVHSYKDLGSVRPEGIVLAAITKRTYANDIMLIKRASYRDLKNKTEFTVGTSSPRRMVNIEKNLAPYLPHGAHLTVKTKMLRGNVNTRIQKLRDGDYDAIVIALPGIERLALTESSHIELKRLLADMNFMIMPQSVFPSSASQGALGIECARNRTDGNELYSKLQRMQDDKTAEEVERERIAFNKYGGGCHLAVGVNVRKLDQFFIHTHRGVLEEKVISVSKLEGRELPALSSHSVIFNGLPSDDLLVKKVPLNIDLAGHAHLYVTSKHCVNQIKHTPESLWAAGTKTMKDLAANGLWVNASSDSLGDEELKSIRASKALALMVDTNAPLSVLSNDQATSTLGKVVACYTREIAENNDAGFHERILSTDVFYWTSYFQYNAYVQKFPAIANRIHICGLGKTYKQFSEKNINIFPVASMEEFKKWTNQ